MRRGLLATAGAFVVLAFVAAAFGAAFPADSGSLGAIPDGPSSTCGNPGTARDVTFAVSGMPTNRPLTDVSVSFQMPQGAHAGSGHTWVGDLYVELIAPGGSPSQTIFSHLGALTANSCGDGSDIAAASTYTFSDEAPASPTFLAAALGVNITTAIPAGSYRASTPGGVAGGNQNTLITPAFAGVTNPNGTWTLRFRDGASGDTGSISAATLSLLSTVAKSFGRANLDVQKDNADTCGNSNGKKLIGTDTLTRTGDTLKVVHAVHKGAPGSTFELTLYDAGQNGCPQIGSLGSFTIDKKGEGTAKAAIYVGGTSGLFVVCQYDAAASERDCSESAAQIGPSEL